MSAKQTRGTKRTCQNPECGSRFYDLNSDPIVCPVCESEYEIPSAPLVVAGGDRGGRRPAKKEYIVVADETALPVEPEVADGEEALAEAAEGAEEPIAAEADETFLEEEEEEGDVTNILGGPVAEGEEEP